MVCFLAHLFDKISSLSFDEMILNVRTVACVIIRLAAMNVSRVSKKEIESVRNLSQKWYYYI